MLKRILMCILLLIALPVTAKGQRLQLSLNGITFTLELLSANNLSEKDSVKIKYSVENRSGRPIAILDIAIPGKDPLKVLYVNDNLDIWIDLGGSGLGGLSMVRKLRIIENGKRFSTNFVLPVSAYIQKLLNKMPTFKSNSPFVKDVPIVASIAYSDSKEFITGQYQEITRFDDYLGYLDNQPLNAIEILLTSFELKGLTVTINL